MTLPTKYLKIVYLVVPLGELLRSYGREVLSAIRSTDIIKNGRRKYVKLSALHEHGINRP
jgi:hypothetical protein